MDAKQSKRLRQLVNFYSRVPKKEIRYSRESPMEGDGEEFEISRDGFRFTFSRGTGSEILNYRPINSLAITKDGTTVEFYLPTEPSSGEYRALERIYSILKKVPKMQKKIERRDREKSVKRLDDLLRSH